MYKKVKWLTILAIAAASTCIFSIGFAYSLSITNSSVYGSNIKHNTENKTEEVVNQLDTNSYNVLVMGDSLAKGAGDENNEGFAGGFVKLWKSKASKPIKVTNIAVNGDTSSGLLNVVHSEQTLKYVQDSSIIFISIGGNEIKNFKNVDISSVDSSLSESKESSSAPNDAKSIENQYLNNLESVFKLIRSKNENCIIVFIGLYNPFGSDITPDKVELLNNWNYKTDELVSSDNNGVYVPTYDLFKYNTQSYLAPDNFHPNAAGYDAISKRIFEVLKNYKN
ncbi:SGNH/GDSL hydrolase family protein [Clostridium kluyveri]|uniref:SGNH/GDSL hydrolase family protein n=1 Tax=Clostridium kluyveri TaxID=1534 RepID=UPI00224598BF|nr:SGNH/GDSL hydrolase family protein [Clostridium kluyveri]UZQ50442.1 GDSL-type esterase/lipase family protein [Clostridium kluyveri]